MTSSSTRKARSPVSNRAEGNVRSRRLSRNYKSYDAKSIFAFVKGNPLTSNVPSKRSKELAREGQSESSGEMLQPDKKKGQGVDSSFEDLPTKPCRRENLKYPLNNPDSPPPNQATGRNATPVLTSAPFVRLGVGPAPASPTGIENPARRGNGSPSPPPPPGLEKPNETAHFHIGSPATSHDRSSSSRTPPRSTKSTPPVPGLARAAQTTPPPLARIDHPSPQVIFQGNDPAGWFAVLQAQWQVCDSYRLAGQVQFEAQQREYAMLLQHQFESMCADLKSKGDTHALKVDYEQQLADLRRRAEVSHASASEG